jgi:phosphomevalonate kinase
MAHNITSAPPAAASAPGKVLLAGGYLVLDRQYTGLVFGLDARIHVQIQRLTEVENHGREPQVLVRSPQFLGAEWRYSFHTTSDDTGVQVIQQSE